MQTINHPKLHRIITPNLQDYTSLCQSFNWKEMQQQLNELPGYEGTNIAYECVERHIIGRLKNDIAIRFIKSDNSVEEYTYLTLHLLSSKFANVLKKLGVTKSNRIATFLNNIPALHIAALGIFKLTAIYCPLNTNLKKEDFIHRIKYCEVSVLITTLALYQEKIKAILPELLLLQYILIVDSEKDIDEKALSLNALMKKCKVKFIIPPTSINAPALINFTDSFSSSAKAMVHVHGAVLMHFFTGKYVLDFHEGDIYWCTATPDSITGISYGMIGALVNGVTNILVEVEMDELKSLSILATQQVSIWHTNSNTINKLMHLNINLKDIYTLDNLRNICNYGEILNEDAISWGENTFNITIADNWWQAETGGMMIANYPAIKIKPGSVGKPLPGIEAAIALVTPKSIKIIEEPNIQGELVFKTNWPSNFKRYVQDKVGYKKCFRGDWYLTGNLARKDEAGYFWLIDMTEQSISNKN